MIQISPPFIKKIFTSAKKTLKRLFQVFFDFYWGEGIADDVPALTYYLLSSLVPFALGITALAAVILENRVSTETLANEIGRYTPPDVQDSLVGLVLRTDEQSVVIFILAVIAMLWTSSGAIGVIERTLARMLNRPRHSIVVGRLRNLGLGAGVALLFLFAAGGAAIASGIEDTLDISSVITRYVFQFANLVFSILICATVFHFAPCGRMRWRATVAGATLAGIGLQILPLLLGLYVKALAGNAAVRIFFVLAAILFSFYLMASVLLISAGIMALTERRLARLGPALQPPFGQSTLQRIRKLVQRVRKNPQK